MKKIIYKFFRQPLLCVMILFLSISSYASEYRLLPEADLFVSQLAPTANYGEANYLQATGWNNSTKEVYLKFRLDGIPGDEILSGATLNLFAFFGAATWANLHHIADDSWNEVETTWSNRPGSGGPGDFLDTAYLDDPSSWLAWDLFASGEWNCAADLEDSYLSLLVKLESNYDIMFFSKEYEDWASRAPFLELTTITVTTDPVPIPSTGWFFLSCLVIMFIIRKYKKHPFPRGVVPASNFFIFILA